MTITLSKKSNTTTTTTTSTNNENTISDNIDKNNENSNTDESQLNEGDVISTSRNSFVNSPISSIHDSDFKEPLDRDLENNDDDEVDFSKKRKSMSTDEDTELDDNNNNNIEKEGGTNPIRTRRRNPMDEDTSFLDSDNESTISGVSSTSTTRKVFKPNVNILKKKKKQEDTKQEEQVKLLEKIKKKPAPKKKPANIEDTYEVIQANDVSRYSLGELIRKRIHGDTMKSTLERERQQEQQRSQLRSQIAAAANSGNTGINMGNGTSLIGNSIVSQGQGDDSSGVEMELVDGKFVVKQNFQTADSIPSNYTVFFEGQHHITNRSFSKKPLPKKWSKEETDRLYDLLYTYGTDFSLIASVFLGRDRAQIRSKFKQEERNNPDLLNMIRENRHHIDIEEFKKTHDEVQTQKKLREENFEKNKNLLAVLDPNATEADLEDISREMNGQDRDLLLKRLTKDTNSSVGTIVEESHQDLESYHKKEQQSQLELEEDPYSFNNDMYGSNDYYGDY